MPDLSQPALLILYLLATLSSSINAAYFGTLPTHRRGHKIGAAVLSLVSFGTLLHSGYGGLSLLLGQGPSAAITPAPQMAAVIIQGVIALGSLAITALVGRRVLTVMLVR